MVAASNRLDAAFPEAASLLQVVGRTLDLAAVAGEEIDAAARACPRRRRALRAAFPALVPGRLARFGERTYRAHCRELLGRVKRGEDMRPGTDAEVLSVLSDASLAAPLSGDYARAMAVVFRSVLPGAFTDAELGEVGRESYAGATDEILRDLRRRTAVDR